MKNTYIRSTSEADRVIAKRIPHDKWEAFMLPGGEVFVDKRHARRKDGSKGQRIKGGMLTPLTQAGKQCVHANYEGGTELINVEDLHAKLFPDETFKTAKERRPCAEHRAGFVVPRVVNVIEPVVPQLPAPTKHVYEGLHAEMEGITSTLPVKASRTVTK